MPSKFAPPKPKSLTSAAYAKAAARLAEAPVLSPFGERLVFRSPREWAELVLPEGFQLAGDNHLCRGDIAFLAGVPACGKSRAAIGLAIAGALRRPWMGLPIHCAFKTMIIQGENGPVRLRSEFAEIMGGAGMGEVDDAILICEPPSEGLAFHDPSFQRQIRDAITEQGTGLLIIDPWNAVSFRDRVEDFRESLADVMACLPRKAEERPAVLIVHHLRKGQHGVTRRRGRDLLAELAGSYVAGAAARTVFVLEPASADPDDDRVIFTVAKANNGKMPASTAWYRRNGLFDPCGDFDWKSWGSPKARAKVSPSSCRRVTLSTLNAVFRARAVPPCSRHPHGRWA